MTNHRRALDRLEASESAAVDPDGDLVTAWRDARARLLAVLGDESLAATVATGRFGAQRFDEVVAGLLAIDTLVHTWDLARSTAQDDALDEASVTRACAFVAAFGDAIRGPGGLGPACASAPDADAATRLLNLCGRTVATRGDPPD